LNGPGEGGKGRYNFKRKKKKLDPRDRPNGWGGQGLYTKLQQRTCREATVQNDRPRANRTTNRQFSLSPLGGGGSGVASGGPLKAKGRQRHPPEGRVGVKSVMFLTIGIPERLGRSDLWGRNTDEPDEHLLLPDPGAGPGRKKLPATKGGKSKKGDYLLRSRGDHAHPQGLYRLTIAEGGQDEAPAALGTFPDATEGTVHRGRTEGEGPGFHP